MKAKVDIPSAGLKVWCAQCCIRIARNEERTVLNGKPITLVVTVQHKGNPVLAGLREAYWRQWEGHYIPEFRVTIREMNAKQHHPRKQQP